MSWEGPADAVRVHFVDALGQPRALAAEGGQALALGLREAEDVDIWLSTTVGDEQVCSSPVHTRTGYLPRGLPESTLTVNEGGPATPTFLVVPILSETGSLAAVFETATGTPVWLWTVPGVSATFRVLPRRDGGGVWVNTNGNTGAVGYLHRVDWDGTYTSVGIPFLSKDFQELPDGRIATLVSEAALRGEEIILGDRIVEIGLDGELTEIWNLFDDYPHGLGELQRIDCMETGLPMQDWAHTNALFWDPAGEDYLISLAQQETIARVDGRTGELEWRLRLEGPPRRTASLGAGARR